MPDESSVQQQRPASQDAHHVSSRGTKRKRAGGEHASNRGATSSADARVAGAQAAQQNGFAHKSSSSNGKMNGDRHARSSPPPPQPHPPPFDRKSNTANARHAHHPQNGIHAAQQRFASLADKRKELLTVRKKLPIWPHAEKIRQSLRGEQDVMLLVGETGSGKSTQVPQFLLTEPWCTGCIAVTQPRRVAAISLARRVAEEMGTPLGSSSPASKVGYSVRFDNSVSPNTRVKFLTEGMLLQELLRDPALRQYSAVIVDEVHERSVNVDLILGFLRNLVRGDKSGRNGQALKVAVMSATADVQKLYDFFEAGRVPSLPTSVPEAEQDDNASDASWRGVAEDEDSERVVNNGAVKKNGSHAVKPLDKTSICFIEGRQYPVQITYLPEPSPDFVESALKAVFQLHMKEPLPGDILVFLTGQDTVESLDKLINEYAETLDPSIPKASTISSLLATPTNTTPDPHPPAVRSPPPIRPTTCLPSRATPNPQDRNLNQHRRNLRHCPRRALRHRQRQAQDKAVPQ
jgi:ATP-dependent RNA helicase DHR2